MLTALGDPGNEKESLLDLLTYIGQNKEYKAMQVEAVLRFNRFLLHTLDSVTTRAIQSMCNTTKSQQRSYRVI
jgi:hypothetical protein